MDYILYEQNGNVATITINREKALNALNSQVLDELNATLDAVDLATVRCLVITGAGAKSFVAGADIGEMSSLTKAEGEAFGKKGNDVFRKIETFPVPVIAAVNGFALGGGCEFTAFPAGAPGNDRDLPVLCRQKRQNLVALFCLRLPEDDALCDDVGRGCHGAPPPSGPLCRGGSAALSRSFLLGPTVKHIGQRLSGFIKPVPKQGIQSADLLWT